MPKTETSRSQVKSISARPTACSRSRSASARPRWKPVSTRSSACSRISTGRKPRTSPGGRPGTRRSEAARLPRVPGGRCITSVRPSCKHTNRNAWKAASSRACRSHGVSRRATTTWGAITSRGRGIWSRPPGAFWPWARATQRDGCSGTCRSRRSPTAIGRRTCGSMARPTGRASRWTKQPCRFSWWISPRARAPSIRASATRSGRWCGVPPRFSPATVPSARRIAGKRTRATPRSPSPPKSPRCWSPPTWPTRRQT